MRALILSFCWLVICCQLAFAQVYQPGFRTLGAWEEDPPMRMNVNIWYPTTRQPKDLKYPPWQFKGALNAKPAEGRFPLIVLSHASPADRFAYNHIAAFLASEGFVVAAPNHNSDWMNNMDDMFTWGQIKNRVQEIEDAIKLSLAEKDLAACIDGNRIGLIGFGSGATAALFIGGALPDCASWPAWCKTANKDDVYCSSWAIERINNLCQSLPLRQSLANPKIKAIAAIAPGFGMLFGTDSFKYFYPPLLLVSAGKDNFNQPALHCERLARFLGPKARFLDLPQADAGALMAPCSDLLAEELPELCLSVSLEVKTSIKNNLNEALLAFFGHYLIVTNNLPLIPNPPELATPENAAAPSPSPSQRKRKR